MSFSFLVAVLGVVILLAVLLGLGGVLHVAITLVWLVLVIGIVLAVVGLLTHRSL